MNQHVLRTNRQNGVCEPPLTVKRKTGGKVTRAHTAIIRDASGNEVARVVYQPDRPLSRGAVCWIKTDLDAESCESRQHYCFSH